MSNILGIFNSLLIVLWVLGGAMLWACTIGTIIMIFEQRRRKRTASPDDDWR